MNERTEMKLFQVIPRSRRIEAIEVIVMIEVIVVIENAE